ncbi:hypothetical protein TSUD_70530 [Trifolium subterraneum]|uniref:Aspartic proteinase Asp1 n=1 Tax=Trifolium subterraneum TaxID=3900 RepID=A0A2Z6M043_TRISU|nr:hypothetical protein TSUD_70530 [Trifolium subterraneum]
MKVAWFGNKRKSGRNYILPDETMFSRPSLMNHAAGSSIVFPIYGNVYPVGYDVLHLPSELTWLQCDAPCSQCSETPHPLYKPSNDFVPCKDPLCASLQPTDDYTCEDPNQCDYEIKYADQYSTLGVLINDVYLLNFTNGVQLKVRMALGCGYDQIFSPSTYHPLDGILGLGRGKASLVSQLNSQGLVRNVIGHCLSSRGGGYIFFGNVYDSSKMSWTPISSIDSGKHYSAGPAELVFGGRKTGVGSLNIIFDTGSSYTYFNSQAYHALITLLNKELNRKPIKAAPDDQTLPMCWHGKRPFRSINEVKKYFKPLTLSFTNGGRVKPQFEIPPEAYLIISKMGNVCLGILNGPEVGLDISMLDKVMVFDNAKQLIGWGPADCNGVPKSRDVSL